MMNSKRKYGKLNICIYLLRIYLPTVICIFFQSLLDSIYPFINYFFSYVIIDALIRQAEKTTLFTYVVIVILANAVFLLLINCFSKMKEVSIGKSELLFQKNLNRKILELDFEFIDSPEYYQIKKDIDQSKMWVGGITKIYQNIELILKNAFRTIIALLAFGFVSVQQVETGVSSVWLNRWITPVFVLTIIAILLLGFVFQLRNNKKLVQLNRQVVQINGGVMALMQLISDYRVGKDIRVYNMQNMLLKKINTMRESPEGMALIRKYSSIKGLSPSVNSMINAVIFIFAYIFAGMKAIYGAITPGAVFLYAGAVHELSSSISELIYSTSDLANSCELLKPYFELIGRESAAGTAGTQEEHFSEAKNVSIMFQDVSFQYPNNKDWGLRDISFHIKAGEKIAFVGANGSGKTTTVKLLCHLYQPHSGKIQIDNTDIHSLSAEQYMKNLSVVFQDFKLFSLPLIENIASGKDYDKIKAHDILTQVGLGDWAKKLPEGLDTFLYHDYEENGIEVSGGESQKIAIARAIYKDAPIIVFDEPTASLDPESEYEIYTRLNSLIKGRTTIFISHRLSSCQFCDRIFVFDEGTIIQEGTHQELLGDVNGKYYSLWNAQAQFYKK